MAQSKQQKNKKVRLDDELCAQGFAATKEEALRLILAGQVSCGGERLVHAGDKVASGAALHVKGQQTFVSRGGLKLERGLSAFGVDVIGLSCVDVGCSTGGFTDCLLKHGASHVLAIDVGYAQFDWGLRHNPRVELLERTNVVDAATPERAGTIDLAVCDVSFTSVITVLGAVTRFLKPKGRFLTLVKPQFEAAKDEVGEGGIVRDPEVRLSALERVSQAFIAHGYGLLGACPSPIKGKKGNQEFLLLGQLGVPGATLNLHEVVYSGMMQ